MSHTKQVTQTELLDNMKQMLNEKILVIEDEETVSMLIEMILERENYHVIRALNGKRGLERAYREQPHLIILDISMPDMDGWEVCRQLRQMTNIPIIFLTAQYDRYPAAQSLDLGANDFITKPFDNSELLARVRVHLRNAFVDGNTTDGIMPVRPIFGLPSIDNDFKIDVFMVMPFDPNMYPIYDNHIRPLVESLNLSIKRGDVFFTKNAIIDDIWAATNGARLIIVDCTGKNPNVFYELGIAHTLGKNVVMITQNKEDIPFDLRSYRYIEYQPTIAGIRHLEERLYIAIVQILRLTDKSN